MIQFRLENNHSCCTEQTLGAGVASREFLLLSLSLQHCHTVGAEQTCFEGFSIDDLGNYSLTLKSGLCWRDCRTQRPRFRAHHVVIKRGGSRLGRMAHQLSAVGPPCAVSSSGMISGLSQGSV